MVKELAENVPRLQLVREALKDYPDVDSVVSGLARNNQSEHSKLPERNIQLVLMTIETLARSSTLMKLLSEPGNFLDNLQTVQYRGLAYDLILDIAA
jgi:hypothetical protein